MVISERDIENESLDWLNKQEGTLAFKIKTEASYDERLGARRKLSKYVLAGTPDICVLLRGSCPFFIEMKKPGGVQSKEQTAFETKCRNFSVAYYLCFSLEEVQQAYQKQKGIYGK